MSQQTEQVEESPDTVGSFLDSLEDWYHVPVLAAAMAFMLWVRLQSVEKFTRNGEVFFSGNDAWYHFRQVRYTVNNWPQTMPFDPWTHFPFGTSVGQFGTLYDQLVATAALVVGLGDPSEQTVAMTLLVAPAVFGALVTIPTYLIGKRLGGRPGGLFGVVILALLPGTFLRRSLVGFADHHIAEPFFQAFAVLAMMIAVTVAERDKPVYELVADRDYDALREPAAYSVLAGIVTALYVWTWPPGVLLIGIFGVFFALKLSADYVRGVSPDHLAFVGTISMAVTGLLLLVPLGTLDPSPTRFSPLQPLLAFAVAGGSAFMAWLGREFDDRGLDAALYPASIAGAVLAIAGVVYLAFPSLFSLIRNNVLRVVGFGTNAATRTIGEAQPFLSRQRPRLGVEWYDVILSEYGLMLFTAIAAAVWMVWRTYRTDDHRAEYLLVLVWSAFIFAAAFTQVRFNYYLAVPVAVLNAYLFGRILAVANLTTREALEDIEGYQVMAVLFAILLVTPVLVVPASIGSSGYASVDRTDTAMQAGQTGPGAGVTNWDGSLDWMANNTPEEGNYGGADNADRLEYYGTYHHSGDYEYPEGAYGVMSWWDYGHWITVEGERIPNANPFQEGANPAARYLLAPSEQQANDVIRTMGEPHEETRFVMVDWKMAEPSSKFSAPTVFNDNVSSGDFYDPVYRQSRQGGYRVGFRAKTQRYYQSQVARLYLYHGSRMDARPVVIDWDAQVYETEDGGQATLKTFPSGQNATVVRRFQTMEQAREFVREDGDAKIGGIGPYPNVKQSEASGADAPRYSRVLRSEMRLLMQNDAIRSPAQMFRTSPAWVKTFERVEGATVTGTAPADTTVTASVRLSPVGQNDSFVYRQQAETGPNGEFTMTLPYSSTGYEDWGPEQGYTNVSVRATGPYEFRTPEQFDNGSATFHNASADVPEAQVIGESDENVTVELTEETVDLGEQNNSTAAEGNQTAARSNETTEESANNSSALTAPSAGADGDVQTRPTPADVLPDREQTTASRAGLVGAWAAAMLFAAKRD
ncbi:dolichyl-diphosphooligosaccharide--protein glycosyltransferase [Halobacteriales archaeon QS_1_67_19]|nr:MAG: dolichyl-diphosphooligosaccharide--protein glycosyltransferase [Halobacteriales archaeon QS_1_67_19]